MQFDEKLLLFARFFLKSSEMIIGLSRFFLFGASVSGAGIVFVGFGDFAVDAFAEEVCAFECADHPVCVGFLDIEKRIGGHEVDATHVDARTIDVFVEQLYEVAGIESVAFACIYENSLHPFRSGSAILVELATGLVFIGMTALFLF